MWTIRQLVQLILPLAEALQRVWETGADFAALEQGVQRVLQQAGQALVAAALEHWDDRLYATREDAVTVVRKAPRTVQTVFGPVTFRRRTVQDRRTGARYCPLDQALGIPARARLSPTVQTLAVQCALETSYHGAARLLQALLPQVDAMTVWHAVQRVGAAERAAQRAVRRAQWERGQTAAGARRVDTLYVESDGVWVRGREKPAHEIKLGVAYEGKTAAPPSERAGAPAASGPAPAPAGRRRLVGRQVYAGVESATAFWETAVAVWSQTWDWSTVQTTHCGSDGAAWCQRGLDYLPGAVHHLDPYHLRRALRTACGHDPALMQRVATGMTQGDWHAVETALTTAATRSRGTQRHALQAFQQYLRTHWNGIVRTATPSLGAIEGQVYHRVATRLKRRGARWSARGADHLVRLLAARANGTLAAAGARVRPGAVPGPAPARRAEPWLQREPGDADPTWLKARVPALHGPHADRPWVRYLLRELVGLATG